MDQIRHGFSHPVVLVRVRPMDDTPRGKTEGDRDSASMGYEYSYIYQRHDHPRILLDRCIPTRIYPVSNIITRSPMTLRVGRRCLRRERDDARRGYLSRRGFSLHIQTICICTRTWALRFRADRRWFIKNPIARWSLENLTGSIWYLTDPIRCTPLTNFPMTCSSSNSAVMHRIQARKS